MRKTLAEEKEENLPDVKQSRTPEGAGGKLISVIIYIALAIILVVLIYYITRINTNTFKVNI